MDHRPGTPRRRRRPGDLKDSRGEEPRVVVIGPRDAGRVHGSGLTAALGVGRVAASSASSTGGAYAYRTGPGDARRLGA